MANISLDHLQIQKARFQELILKQKRVNNPLVTLTDMIYYVDLRNGQRTYEGINMNENDTPVYPERKLFKEQMFLPMYVAYYLTKRSVNKTNTGIFDGNYPWFTYPDANYFTDQDANSIKESDCLNTIYNGGSFSIQNDGKYVLREVSGHHMLYRPGRPFMTAGGSGETNPVLQQWGPGKDLKGYHRLENDIVFKGGEDNKLAIKLGSGNVDNLEGGNTDANTANRLIISCLGLWYYGEVTNAKGFCSLP